MMVLRYKDATELVQNSNKWQSGGCYSGIRKNREGKILRQMYKSYSFFKNQTSFRLNKLIHKNDWIKMLRFAEQTLNACPLWVSPA